jgi:signal peptidase I
VVFLYQPVKVEGTSMLPELRDSERIFVNKFLYRIEEINRKDIVVFWYPKDPSKSYIKRIIGMPGDTVEIIDGAVYINEQLLTEPYVDSQLYRPSLLTGRFMSTPAITMCSAITAISLTTAAFGDWCPSSTFTARPSFAIGP